MKTLFNLFRLVLALASFVGAESLMMAQFGRNFASVFSNNRNMNWGGGGGSHSFTQTAHGFHGSQGNLHYSFHAQPIGATQRLEMMMNEVAAARHRPAVPQQPAPASTPQPSRTPESPAVPPTPAPTADPILPEPLIHAVIQPSSPALEGALSDLQKQIFAQLDAQVLSERGFGWAQFVHFMSHGSFAYQPFIDTAQGHDATAEENNCEPSADELYASDHTHDIRTEDLVFIDELEHHRVAYKQATYTVTEGWVSPLSSDGRFHVLEVVAHNDSDAAYAPLQCIQITYDEKKDLLKVGIAQNAGADSRTLTVQASRQDWLGEGTEELSLLFGFNFKPIQKWFTDHQTIITQLVDGFQVTLDFAGMVPVVGAGADLLNAGILLCEANMKKLPGACSLLCRLVKFSARPKKSNA